jgi:molybdopterin-containing oxidoreductase family iron-sulfur binding subunit
VPPAAEPVEKFIAEVAADLLAWPGGSIVIPGDNQPPSVHALAHLLNHSLGNVGHTITHAASAEAAPVNQFESLRNLSDALAGKQVDTLIILGGNPAFNAPADFDFAGAMDHAGFRVHLSSEVNETSRLCDWHIPENHFLESWSDARAFDGTISVIQPLILPLYNGRSPHELLDAITVVPGRTDYEIVRDFWHSQHSGTDFESWWHQTLHDGLVAGSAAPARSVSLRTFPMPSPENQASGLEVSFRPDPTIWDGRYANNAWLQELPKPITKLVWDDVAHVSPSLASQENLSNGDVIQISAQGRTLNAPVWIVPGQPERTIGLQFGYGRTTAGPVGQNVGGNVYALRTSGLPWAAAPVSLKRTGQNYSLASTQIQHVIDSPERQIIREGTFAEFKAHPDFVRTDTEAPSETLFDPKEYKYEGYRWGMAIDLSACIGCSACVVACQAENNIPVVGKQEVSRGRAMHWIRVDSYFRGAADNPQISHQPVPCMHCENAPCELVCPVGATLHDKEGLNVQVYNRCVGTRYCSNNCPYKVRRFNFFQYADYHTPSLVPMRNPNVTVRWRGVMEKCTYCIQRISAARIASEERGSRVADGEIQTACQQVCPAQAIVFGDLGDPHSGVSKIKSHPLNFSMLGQLNTRPRTTYLAALRNPNPART